MRLKRHLVFRWSFLWLYFGMLVYAQDIIRGTYTYTYGDNESLVEARETCKKLAIRDAIESYYIFVESTTTVENNVIKQDIINALTAQVVKNLKIVDQKEENRTITMTIEGEVDPQEVEKLLKERTSMPSHEVLSDTIRAEKDTANFSAMLSKYENRIHRVELAYTENRLDEALNELETLHSIWEKPPKFSSAFNSIFVHALMAYHQIFTDFIRIEKRGEHVPPGRKRTLPREFRDNMWKLEIAIHQLEKMETLTEREKILRRVWIPKFRALIFRVRQRIHS